MTPLSDTAVIVVHWGPAEATLESLAAFRRLYPITEAPRLYVVENGPPVLSMRPGTCTHLRLSVNQGYGSANNVGMREALRDGARFLLLLNNDARLMPGALEAMREAADALDVGVVGARIHEGDRVVWGGGRVSWWTLRANLAAVPTSAAELHYIHGACLGITRACAEQVGLFREDLFLYWEDVEYGLRARRAGFRFAVAAGAEVEHSATPAPAGDDAKSYFLVRNAHYVLGDHGTPLARLWTRAVRPARRVVARLRSKPAVSRALADAARGIRGPAPAPLTAASV